MDDFTVKLVGAIAALIPICWGAWQLWHGVFGKLAKKEEIEQLRATFNERNAAVDKLLEDRRQDVVTLHEKVDDRVGKLDDKIDRLKDVVSQGFSDIKDLLLRRMP